MSSTVSIIVPAYNCEKTIRRTIESVLNQSYNDWKLLIINDGSTDNTQSICEKYAATDRRIQILNQVNAGVSKTRNRGLDIADSKYIAFLDSDDTYHPEFLKVMINSLESTNTDFAMCGFSKVNSLRNECASHILDISRYDFSKPEKYNIGEKSGTILDSRDFLYLFFQGCPCGTAAVWNKVFRSDLIKKAGVRFDESRNHGEDWKFNIELLDSGKISGVVLPYTLYNYYETPGGLSQKINIIKPGHKFDSAQLIYYINDKYKFNCEDKINAGTAENFVSYIVGLNKILGLSELSDHIAEYKQNKYIKSALSNVWKLPVSLKTKILTSLGNSGIVGLAIFRLGCKLRF